MAIFQKRVRLILDSTKFNKFKFQALYFYTQLGFILLSKTQQLNIGKKSISSY